MARVKVVLREPVDKLGDAGDVVSVSGGFARNFLIPRGLAVAATKGNLKQAATFQASRGALESRELASATDLKARLEAETLRVTVQAGPDGRLFGSITAADVAEAIAAQSGIEIDRHVIELPEPIRHLGVHEVQVALHAQVTASVRIEVSAGS
jgi:large subunit ribosomal protein L9